MIYFKLEKYESYYQYKYKIDNAKKWIVGDLFDNWRNAPEEKQKILNYYKLN